MLIDGQTTEMKYKPANKPWRNNQQGDSHVCPLLWVCRREMVQHQSIKSCDPEKAWLISTDSGSRSERHIKTRLQQTCN